jgi:hypothetical protein
LSWLPIVLLLAIAANHFRLVRCCDLQAWLGGGFGMFSTVDNRSVAVWRVGPDGEERIALPRALDDAARRAGALPTESRLAELGRAVLVEGALPGVRVEVWETRYDASLNPEPKRLRSLTVDGGRP